MIKWNIRVYFITLNSANSLNRINVLCPNIACKFPILVCVGLFCFTLLRCDGICPRPECAVSGITLS